MKFTKENAGEANLVRGWHAGGLQINDRLVAGPVIVSAEVVHEAALPAPDALDEQSLAAALALEPEVLLLGTGARQRRPHASLVAALGRRGVGLEVMDTLAAARTYNVLVGEQRRVVAVLYPHES